MKTGRHRDLHRGVARDHEVYGLEVVARAEAARANVRSRLATYVDRSKCYERVGRELAIAVACEIGYESIVVAFSFDNHFVDRRISAHGAEAGGVKAGRGLPAGCDFA